MTLEQLRSLKVGDGVRYTTTAGTCDGKVTARSRSIVQIMWAGGKGGW